MCRRATPPTNGHSPASSPRQRLADLVNGILLDTERDYAANATDAWVYGATVGWDPDDLEHLSAKYGWTDEDVLRMQQHQSLVQLLADPPEPGPPLRRDVTAWPLGAELFERAAQAAGMTSPPSRARLFEAFGTFFDHAVGYRSTLGDGTEVDLVMIARDDHRYPADPEPDWLHRPPTLAEQIGAVREFELEAMAMHKAARAKEGGAA